MYADVRKKCAACRRLFWLTGDEQKLCRNQKIPLPDRCPKCRPKAGSTEMSSALATIEQLRASAGDVGAGLLPDLPTMFADVVKLIKESAAPTEVRRRTFWEWMRGLDLEAVQIKKKLRAGNAADQLLRQRLDLIRRLQEVTRMRYEAAEAESVQRQRLLQAHLNELKLQEEIALQQALRDQRMKTQQLEETRKQAHLLSEINPPAPPPSPKKKDPVKQVINEHRRGVRAKSTAKQLALSDFITEVQKYFGGHDEDSLKVVRIRTVLEVYHQDLEALPKDVREFVERVERGEEANRE